MKTLVIAATLATLSAPAALAAPAALPSIGSFAAIAAVPVFAPKHSGGIVGTNIVRWIIKHLS